MFSYQLPHATTHVDQYQPTLDQQQHYESTRQASFHYGMELSLMYDTNNSSLQQSPVDDYYQPQLQSQDSFQPIQSFQSQQPQEQQLEYGLQNQFSGYMASNYPQQVSLSDLHESQHQAVDVQYFGNGHVGIDNQVDHSSWQAQPTWQHIPQYPDTQQHVYGEHNTVSCSDPNIHNTNSNPTLEIFWEMKFHELTVTIKKLEQKNKKYKKKLKAEKEVNMVLMSQVQEEVQKNSELSDQVTAMELQLAVYKEQIDSYETRNYGFSCSNCHSVVPDQRVENHVTVGLNDATNCEYVEEKEIEEDDEFDNDDSIDEDELYVEEEEEGEVEVEVEERNCIICMDSITSDSSWSSITFAIDNCGHQVHLKCMENMAKNAMEIRAVPIICPVCVGEASSEPSKISSDNLDAYGLLEPEQCRNYSQWILEKQLKMLNCPHCNIQSENENPYAVDVTCPHCHKIFCSKCLVKWTDHTNANTGMALTCQEYQELPDDLRAHDDRMLQNLAKNMGWKQCPQCRITIDKTKGCNHMKCTMCSCEFCYLCGERVVSTEAHYNDRDHVMFHREDIED